MILVFGQTGQVATELTRQAGDRVIYLGCEAANLSSPAAWPAVDKAEARVINSDAPAAMARNCAAQGIPLVHISTDYVFAGTSTASYVPLDPVAPQNAYGSTKLAGEEGVCAAGGTHAILRTSWVVSAHGSNFVTTMLRMGGERDRQTIVADQISGPTPAADIARLADILTDIGALK